MHKLYIRLVASRLQNDFRELKPDNPEIRAGLLLTISRAVREQNLRLAKLLATRYSTATTYLMFADAVGDPCDRDLATGVKFKNQNGFSNDLAMSALRSPEKSAKESSNLAAENSISESASACWQNRARRTRERASRWRGTFRILFL